MARKPLTFDIKRIDSDGVLRDGKEVYVSDKIDSPRIISSGSIIKGIQTQSFEKGSDGKNYTVYWDENGQAEDAVEN